MRIASITLIPALCVIILSGTGEASDRGRFLLSCEIGYKPTATISDLDNPVYARQPELVDILPLQFTAGCFFSELFNTQLQFSYLSKTDRSLSRQRTNIRNFGLTIHTCLYWPLTDSGDWILTLFGGPTFGWGRVRYSTAGSADETRGESFGISGGFGFDYYLSRRLFFTSSFTQTVLKIPTEGQFGSDGVTAKVDLDLSGPSLDFGVGTRF